MERVSRDVWAKRVERWQDSGLTAKEFAAELDVSASSLTFWKWKLRRLANPETARVTRRRSKAKPDDTSPPFLQLVPTTTSPQPSSSPFEVVLANGVVVRVPQDFDESTLQRLVGALGGR